jgi:spore maturation protein CgeB
MNVPLCFKSRHLLIVGSTNPVQLGSHLLNAAHLLGVAATIFDSEKAYRAWWPVAKANWWFRGHMPSHLKPFSRAVLEACRTERPTWLITGGISPISANVLAKIGSLGIARINFLTDDPLNPAHRAPWFLESLPHYDHIFSPRIANISDIRALGCRSVSYLPFAYSPEAHFIDEGTIANVRAYYESDIIFVGGADKDRVLFAQALIEAGFNPGLYGGYWQRYSVTRPYAKGHLNLSELRVATRAAKVVLCLVRRANRDDHVMRTFEVPAMGGCMLVEYSTFHESIFGPDGDAVVYFRNTQELTSKLRWLLEHPSERRRLADAAHRIVVQGGHTYADRLRVMLAHGEDR